MKFYKFLFIILIIFSKTGNVLSNNNIFSVNNIELTKKDFDSNQQYIYCGAIGAAKFETTNKRYILTFFVDRFQCFCDLIIHVFTQFDSVVRTFHRFVLLSAPCHYERDFLDRRYLQGLEVYNDGILIHLIFYS